MLCHKLEWAEIFYHGMETSLVSFAVSLIFNILEPKHVCKNIEEYKNYTCWIIITITISEPAIEQVIEPLSESISEPL